MLYDRIFWYLQWIAVYNGILDGEILLCQRYNDIIMEVYFESVWCVLKCGKQNV